MVSKDNSAKLDSVSFEHQPLKLQIVPGFSRPFRRRVSGQAPASTSAAFICAPHFRPLWPTGMYHASPSSQQSAMETIPASMASCESVSISMAISGVVFEAIATHFGQFLAGPNYPVCLPRPDGLPDGPAAPPLILPFPPQHIENVLNSSSSQRPNISRRMGGEGANSSNSFSIRTSNRSDTRSRERQALLPACQSFFLSDSGDISSRWA